MANPKKLPKWAIKQAGGINKKAWALARRGRLGKGKKHKKRVKAFKKAMPKRKRSKSVTKKGNPNNRSPKIGAAIQALKGTQAVVAPVLDAVATRGLAAGARPALINDLKAKASLDTGGSLAIEGINHIVDRKIAQGAALSRGSVTAWAAEGFAGVTAFEAAKGKSAREGAKAVNISLSRTIRAYDPQGKGKIDTGDSNFRTYQLLKVGGGAIRRASNKGPFKRMFAPIKKFLGEMGGAL